MNFLNAAGQPITPAGETHFVKQLQTIAGLIDQPSKMFVTSSHWGQIAGEIKRQYASALTDPAGLPRRENFGRLMIGKLLVINSGTEDQEVVNLMNEEDARQSNFAWRRDNLISGRA